MCRLDGCGNVQSKQGMCNIIARNIHTTQLSPCHPATTRRSCGMFAHAAVWPINCAFAGRFFPEQPWDRLSRRREPLLRIQSLPGYQQSQWQAVYVQGHVTVCLLPIHSIYRAQHRKIFYMEKSPRLPGPGRCGEKRKGTRRGGTRQLAQVLVCRSLPCTRGQSRPRGIRASRGCCGWWFVRGPGR